MTNITSPTAAELDRFLTGTAAPDEASRIERWIASDPQRHATAQALKTIDSDSRAPSLGTRWDALAPHVLGEQRTSPERVVRHTLSIARARSDGNHRAR